MKVENRIRGAVLGAAIGDAFGAPNEFVAVWPSAPLLREPPNPALVTDDSQLAEATILGLLDAGPGAPVPAVMAALSGRYTEWARNPKGGHRAPGGACLAGCAALARGTPWYLAGGATAGGCGSVMRAYPFGLVLARAGAISYATASSMLTHRDPIALASCAAMAAGVWEIVWGRRRELKHVVDSMAAAAAQHCERTAGMLRQAGEWSEYHMPRDDEVFGLWRGWAAHEATAAGLYAFLRHPSDVRAALALAANTPGDSDSIATIAGALVGAWAGADAIPDEWVSRLERRDDFEAHARALAAYALEPIEGTAGDAAQAVERVSAAFDAAEEASDRYNRGMQLVLALEAEDSQTGGER
jgi:ADP-ribosylglycohydrolase